MYNNYFNLPDIEFIGGDSFPIAFELYKDEAHKAPFEVDDEVKAYFSVIHYINRDYTEPIFTLDSDMEDDCVVFKTTDDQITNILVVTIPYANTLFLHGKYLYQITLVDGYGKGEILGQGVMNISRNIDPSILSN